MANLRLVGYNSVNVGFFSRVLKGVKFGDKKNSNSKVVKEGR